MDEETFNSCLKVFFFVFTLPFLPVTINILKDTIQEKNVYDKACMFAIASFLLSVHGFTWYVCFFLGRCVNGSKFWR